MNVTGPETAHTDSSRTPASSILFVITKANWGGGQKYVYDLAFAAKEAGHDVSVAFGLDGELSQRLLQKEIPIYPIRGMARDVSLQGDFISLMALVTLFRKLRPDVVHASSSKAGFVATLAARLTGVQKIIFTAHGWAFNETRPLWQKFIFALFHLVTVWCSHEVICVSEAVRKDAAWMPFSKQKFAVIHNGIESVALIEKAAARAQLAPHILATTWIGNLAELHPTKAQDIAIEAFAKIATEFPETALVFIGEGQSRARLEALIRERGLIDRIALCGHVQNAPEFLSALDIFLFPSRSEALAYAVLEAGNASLPVVASRVGGIPEIIENNVSGLLVERNDVEGFADALTSLLKDESLQKGLGSALHTKIQDSFSKTSMIQKTLALYSSS
jgi:glycosyltransferase involved in cell wall biosynthesis